MSTSEYRAVDAESDLLDQRGRTRRAGQPAVRGQHPARFRQSAAVGAGCPARQRARHNGGRLGRSDGGGRRGPVPGAGSVARRPRRLPSGSDFARNRSRHRRRFRSPRGATCRIRRQRPSTAATCRRHRGSVPAATISSAFAVPTEGIVPTLPGVLAGGTPTRRSLPAVQRRRGRRSARGSRARWTDTVPAAPNAPAGDEAQLLLPRHRRCRPGAAVAGPARDFRRQRDAGRLPDPARDRQRQAADLVRQRGHHAEAAGGDRPAGVFLRARELQHPPRRTRVGRPGHRRLRGGPRHRSALHRSAKSEQHHLRARHHRSHQPGGPCVGRQAPPAGRRDRHHPPGASRQYRSLADDLTEDRSDPQGGSGRRRRQPAARTSSRTCSAREPNWLRPARSPTRWAR